MRILIDSISLENTNSMKHYNSEKFGTIDQPESFEELISLIISEPIETDNNVRYWRGQSDIDWGINSSAHRRLLNTKMYSNDFDAYLRDYELSLLEQATHKGYRFQNGRELFDFELLGKLQLHGAATRLMDFSKNALVALWFCVSSYPSKTGLLLGIHTNNLIGYENKILSESYKDIINECEEGGLFTWAVPNISARTAAQHSQFLYSKFSRSGKGSLILPEGEHATLFISISPFMKQLIKSILERAFDLWTITLFPDLDGFGQANNQSISRWEMNRW